MLLKQELQKRILVIDGAMGTMIQKHHITEADYRGERFKDWHVDVKGIMIYYVLHSHKLSKAYTYCIWKQEPISLKPILSAVR